MFYGHRGLVQLVKNKLVSYKDAISILAGDVKIPLVGDLVSLQ